MADPKTLKGAAYYFDLAANNAGKASDFALKSKVQLEKAASVVRGIIAESEPPPAEAPEEDPADPEVPEVPEQPEEPEAPTEPETPEEPEEPTPPTDPEPPTEPEDPDPVDPDPETPPEEPEVPIIIRPGPASSGSSFDPTSLYASMLADPRVPDYAQSVALRSATDGDTWTDNSTGIDCVVIKTNANPGYPGAGGMIQRPDDNGKYPVFYHADARGAISYKLVDPTDLSLSSASSGPPTTDETRVFCDPFDRDAMYYQQNGSGTDIRKWRISTGGDVTEGIFPLSGPAAAGQWLSMSWDWPSETLKAVYINQIDKSNAHIYRVDTTDWITPPTFPSGFDEGSLPTKWSNYAILLDVSGGHTYTRVWRISDNTYLGGGDVVSHMDWVGDKAYGIDPRSSYFPYRKFVPSTDTFSTIIDRSHSTYAFGNDGSGHSCGVWTDQFGLADTEMWMAKNHEAAGMLDQASAISWTLESGNRYSYSPSLGSYGEDAVGAVYQWNSASRTSVDYTLTKVDSTAAVEATAGTFYWEGPKVHVHCFGGGSPAGKIQCADRRGPFERSIFIKLDSSDPQVRLGPAHFGSQIGTVDSYDKRTKLNLSPDGAFMTWQTTFGVPGGSVFLCGAYLGS